MKLSLANITVQLPGMDKPLFSISNQTIASGARVLIQGPSGRGKTTLLHLLAGLLAPREGVVKIDENDLARLGENERSRFRREHLGIIFQKLNLIGHLTAAENVALGARTAAAVEGVRAALAAVKLEKSADVLAQNLSLGQQQRVAVARVLLQRPALVLADEPTSSLDDDTATAVMDALFNLPASTTIVVVSHDHRIRDRFREVHDFEKWVRGQ